MSKKYYEDKNRNAYEVKTPLEELMWKEIEEMWDELLPKIEERDKYKNRIDKAIEYIEDSIKFNQDNKLQNDLLDILKGE